jgi:hypothetical protein
MAAGEALHAASTGEVDLADHPSTDERFGAGNDVADELMTEDAAEPQVAMQDLQVGRTDPCQPHTHDGASGCRNRIGGIGHQSEPVTIPGQRTHRG